MTMHNTTTRATTWLLAAASAVALVTAPASAGVAYEIAGTDHDHGTKKTFTIEVVIEGDQVRMKNDMEGDKASEMIYRGDRGELLLIDHSTKNYVVLDQELAGSLGAMIDDGIKEALAQVPEAQRAEIEELMKAQFSGENRAERPEIEVRNTREKAEMNGRACTKHEIVEDGNVVREHCIAPWDSLEGGNESVAAFRSMSDFYRELLDAIREVGVPMDEELENPFDHLEAMGGFPVVTRELDADGSLTSEWHLVSSKKRAFEPAEFEPPSGYTREEMAESAQ